MNMSYLPMWYHTFFLFLSKQACFLDSLILHLYSIKKCSKLNTRWNQFFFSFFKGKHVRFIVRLSKKESVHLVKPALSKVLISFSPMSPLSFFLKGQSKIASILFFSKKGRSKISVKRLKYSASTSALFHWKQIQNKWRSLSLKGGSIKYSFWKVQLSKYQTTRLYSNIISWWFLYWAYPKSFDYGLLGMLIFWFIKLSSSKQVFFKYLSYCFCLISFLSKRFRLESCSSFFFKKNDPIQNSSTCHQEMSGSYKQYLVMLFYLYDSVQKELKQGYRAYKLVSLGNRGKLCSLYSLNYWHNFVCFKVYKVYGWLFTHHLRIKKKGSFETNENVKQGVDFIRSKNYFAHLVFVLHQRISNWYIVSYTKMYISGWSAYFHLFLKWFTHQRWSFFVKELSFCFHFFSDYMFKYLFLWSKQLRTTYGAFFTRQALLWRIRNMLNASFSTFHDSFYSCTRFKYGWFKLKAKQWFRRQRWYRRYKYYYFYKKNVESISRKHPGFKKIPFSMRQKWRRKR